VPALVYTHANAKITLPDLDAATEVVLARGSAGKSYTLFDAWNNWVGGQKPDVVISADPRTDKCPGE
jgi:hypothetical protein